jgi:hypothetical protein
MLDLRRSLFLMAALLDGPTTASSRYGRPRARLAPHSGFAEQILAELVEIKAIVRRTEGTIYRSWATTATPAPAADAPWTLCPELAAIPNLESEILDHAKALSYAAGADEELFTLWRELAISEVAGFLANELHDHRFDEQWALVAIPAIEKGLRRLSVSQMFYFCWMAVRETASRYLRFPAMVHTLSENLVTYIDQRIDRALAERWAIRDWAANSRRIPSGVAISFAERLTDLGSDYLSTVPSRARLDLSALRRRT